MILLFLATFSIIVQHKAISLWDDYFFSAFTVSTIFLKNLLFSIHMMSTKNLYYDPSHQTI